MMQTKQVYRVRVGLVIIPIAFIGVIVGWWGWSAFWLTFASHATFTLRK